MALELQLVQEQLGKNKGHLVTQDTINELNKLVEDPDYGEEFLESYINYFNIIDNNNAWSTPKYLNALKFFTLLESGHSAVDAYVKVFPERLQSRLDKGQSKTDMGGEASRYNSSMLVSEIKKVATVPVQLIHRHLLHEAILTQADLMKNARSEQVRQKAAETIIRELKPTEKSEIQIDINNKQETSVIDSLRKATEELVLEQMRSIEAGKAVKQIAESSIIEAEIEDNENGK